LEAENLYNGLEVTGCRFTFWIPVSPLIALQLESTTFATELPVDDLAIKNSSAS